MNIDTYLLAEIAQNIAGLQLQLDYEREKIITALGGEPALYDVTGTGALTATTAKLGTGSAIAGAALQVDGGSVVVGDGAGTTKARLATTGGILGAAFRTGRKESLADDTVYSFSPGINVGFILITLETVSTAYLLAAYRAAATAFFSAVASGTTIEILTPAVLNDGDGTDGKLAITCYTDGKIYISNRTGGSKNFTWTLFGGGL